MPATTRGVSQQTKAKQDKAGATVASRADQQKPISKQPLITESDFESSDDSASNVQALKRSKYIGDSKGPGANIGGGLSKVNKKSAALMKVQAIQPKTNASNAPARLTKLEILSSSPLSSPPQTSPPSGTRFVPREDKRQEPESESSDDHSLPDISELTLNTNELEDQSMMTVSSFSSSTATVRDRTMPDTTPHRTSSPAEVNKFEINKIEVNFVEANKVFCRVRVHENVLSSEDDHDLNGYVRILYPSIDPSAIVLMVFSERTKSGKTYSAGLYVMVKPPGMVKAPGVAKAPSIPKPTEPGLQALPGGMGSSAAKKDEACARLLEYLEDESKKALFD